MRLKFFLLALLILPSLHCAKDHEARPTAEKFIQTYYVNINPGGALPISMGPAAKKIKEELRLLKGVAPLPPEKKPKMTYKLKSCVATGESQAQCAYDLFIPVKGVGRRSGTLILEKHGGTWQVLNFIEKISG